VAEAATVVVPVYGASPDLERCLSAVVAHTDLSRHRLVVVADGPPAPEARRVAEAAVAQWPGRVRLVERPARGGYPAAANAGIREAAGDVALLNSDTEVTAGWLEKLGEAARRRPRIASATPFSNNATLCSLPRPFVENALPAGHTVASFARLVEERSTRLSPEIPTGVGFCLFMTREAIEEVGLLDEEGFGIGYGEEVDWCLRASARGFAHVLDDATFVWHRGGGSFGKEAAGRARASERLLARRHPGFLPGLARFMREDPLSPVRERVVDGLRPARRTRAAEAGPARVVHLVHGWPPQANGGTEVFARTLALFQARRREVAVYARLSDPTRPKGDAVELVDGGVRVRLVVNDFHQRDPLSRNALYDRVFSADFDRFLDGERPDLLHVHHLAGHAATLPGLARRRGLPVVCQLQDWWPLCARVNLLHASGEICTGPSPVKCARCRPLTGLPPAAVLNPALHALRAALMRRALAADRYVAGSRFLVRSWGETGWLPGGAPVEVVPYGIPYALPERPHSERALRTPLRFGFVGALMPHKGAHVAVEAFCGVPPDAARLRIWGDPDADPAYVERMLERTCGADVRIEGRFREEEKSRVFSDMDVLLVPSVGLESYGIVVDEAMAHGVPVVASRRGALPERFEESCGAFVPAGDPGALRAVIESLVARPEAIVAWRRALPPVRTLEDAAERIEEIYAGLFVTGVTG
jgi:GT2 family glycosyltransferase/glycosyltransferase involved in cell wall biosynthesis